MDRDRVCPICGHAFRVRWSGDTKTYCSPTCRGVARRTTATRDTIGRHIALTTYPAEQPCEVCGKTGRGRGVIDRHHRNSDRLDNSPENIAFLCRKHHHAAHKLTDGKVGGGPRPRVVALMHDRAVLQAGFAAALRDSGVSIDSIAAQMGVHHSTVTRWFRKYGI